MLSPDRGDRGETVKPLRDLAIKNRVFDQHRMLVSYD